MLLLYLKCLLSNSVWLVCTKFVFQIVNPWNYANAKSNLCNLANQKTTAKMMSLTNVS